MKKIFIKYNPYQLKTEVLIDGKTIKNNSRFNVGDKRLQEWVDDIPDILSDECNVNEIEFEFYGTIEDYEDIFALKKEIENKNIKVNFKYIPAKEVKEKEIKVKKVFEKIQNGPFDEFRSPDILKAFESANSNNFEVNVVATMSAGKSTLINSLLATKLMPAKQEACTAIITEIKDNDLDHFEVRAYDKNGNLIEENNNLVYEDMEKLNSNSNVSKVEIQGNIPFLTSEDTALILVDTPGPNNSRDPEHKKATFKMLSESSKTLVLYIMNATQLAVDDDNRLLRHVSESMKVGGKQSRDRFIFVVNKLDDFVKGQDNVEETLKKVKEYLVDNGIEDPNIYPTSALTALNIRTILAESDDEDDDEVYNANGKVRKFNRNSEMHFEKYSPLPTSVRENINERLIRAEKEENVNEQALIHSGIVSIEEAIRLYVRKYAKTAKIKNIVDTFMSKIESEEIFEKTKQSISENEEMKKETREKIELIENKINSGKEAKNFREKIEKISYKKEIESYTEKLNTKFQEEITDYTERYEDEKLNRKQAESLYKKLIKFAKDLEAEIGAELENLISNNMQKNANALLNEYINKVRDLTGGINIKGINIEPLKIIRGEISNNNNNNNMNGIISSSTRIEEILVGQKRVSNKKWYNPFSWLRPDTFENEYEEREYVDGEVLVQKFFAPIENNFINNCKSAIEYAENQAEKMKKDFEKKFDELDKILLKKLEELKFFTSNEKEIEKMLEESKYKLKWCEDIMNEVNEILDI